jgi:lysophospholipase L1-like esterase
VLVVLLAVALLQQVLNRHVCILPETNTIYAKPQGLEFEELDYVLKPNSRHFINSQGFRDDEPLRASYDIIVVGDSITFGAGIYNNSQLFTALLENKFIPPRQVMNAGIPGYGFHEEKIFYDLVISKLDADIVVLQVSPNDLYSSFMPLDVLTDEFYAKHRLLHKLNSFFLIRCTEKVMLKSKLKGVTQAMSEDEYFKERNKQDFRELVDDVLNDNVTLIVLESPSLIEDQELLDKEIHSFVKGVAEEKGLMYIDAFPILMEKTGNKISSLQIAGAHYNSEGHAMLADIFYEYIQKNNLLDEN